VPEGRAHGCIDRRQVGGDLPVTGQPQKREGELFAGDTSRPAELRNRRREDVRDKADARIVVGEVVAGRGGRRSREPTVARDDAQGCLRSAAVTTEEVGVQGVSLFMATRHPSPGD
jgi:hypothetical protein